MLNRKAREEEFKRLYYGADDVDVTKLSDDELNGIIVMLGRALMVREYRGDRPPRRKRRH